jgi:glycogen synthase
MRILISSYAFAPSIGGIETTSGLLAEEFARHGHTVIVVTQTESRTADTFLFAIVRRPSIGKLFRLTRWCDVYWQNNLSVRTIWPALLLRKPTLITHQGSYLRRPSGFDVLQRLKHWIVNHTTSVAISRPVAACFKNHSTIIPNPYHARLFAPGLTSTERTGDLVFVGRLVAEKGLDILLAALGSLRVQGILPRLTVVGLGPELGPMQEATRNLGLRDRVLFVGAKQGPSLVKILQQHKLLVIPSRYEEPFGIVALEGIACGCAVIGSSGGGLPEAIGPCGVMFPNGDDRALAKVLDTLLRQPNERLRLIANAPGHLARFHPAKIAASYLALFQSKLS